MLHIRLARVGKVKQPTYRLVISEKSRDPWGRVLENLGNYNPRAKEKVIDFNAERIKFYLERGAQASNTVHNLLVSQGIISGKKRKSVKISNKRTARIAEAKAKAEGEKAKAEAAAAAAATPAPTPEPEPPAP